jgi:hypothetical protein
VNIKAPAGASAAAAAVAAGHGVLTRLYPAQKATLDAALTASLAKIPDGEAKVGGINVGKEVAEKLVAIEQIAKVSIKPRKLLASGSPLRLCLPQRCCPIGAKSYQFFMRPRRIRSPWRPPRPGEDKSPIFRPPTIREMRGGSKYSLSQIDEVQV